MSKHKEMEHELLTDFYGKIVDGLYRIEDGIFSALHLTREQYAKLTSTEEGRKKLSSVISAKPELMPLLMKLEAVTKVHSLISEQYNTYLPF